MDRLTSDKDVKDMGMVELAYNSCYAKDGKARYRDYDIDIDARQLAIELLERYADIPNEFTCDDDFDDRIIDYMSYGMENPEGLIALFYRNLWAMADLRERLKRYEDAEEQKRLLKLPCAVGDTVYVKIASYCDSEYAEAEVRDFTHFTSCGFCVVVTSEKFNKCNIPFSEFGKTIFPTRKQAEKALKEMTGEAGQ